MLDMKVALCAIAKNENKYIREWVTHYHNLGVDTIYLYDNNDQTGEQFNSVINDYIQDGFVKIINYRGKKTAQISAYRDCFCKYRKENDWIMFFDCDEFLFFEGTNLKTFLSSSRASRHQCILVNWKIYDDNNLLVYEDIPVLERFTHPSEAAKSYDNFYSNNNCKSIVKCSADITVYGCHIQRNTMQDYCDTAGNKLTSVNFDPWYTKTVKLVYDNCYIKHFVTKTAEEFYKRRIRGTRPAGSKQLDKNRRINQFFSINTPTDEKHLILNQK